MDLALDRRQDRALGHVVGSRCACAVAHRIPTALASASVFVDLSEEFLFVVDMNFGISAANKDEKTVRRNQCYGSGCAGFETFYLSGSGSKIT